jgi:hypothetical protein
MRWQRLELLETTQKMLEKSSSREKTYYSNIAIALSDQAGK